MTVGRQGALRTWDASEGFALAAGRNTSWATQVDQVDPTDTERREKLVSALNHHNVGKWAEASGRLGDAVVSYRKERALRAAVKSKQGDYRSWGRLGGAFYRVERFEDARQALEEAIALRGDVGPTIAGGPRWWYLTMVLAKLGEEAKAREHFDQLTVQRSKVDSPNRNDSLLGAEAAELLGAEHGLGPSP